jgi:hypothetical protein
MEHSDNQSQTMKLTTYVNLVKTYFQNQKQSVRKLGYCYGWDNRIFHYNSVNEYKEHVEQQINSMIKEGSLIEDIDLSKALRELDGEKPDLKIYKQKEII